MRRRTAAPDFPPTPFHLLYAQFRDLGHRVDLHTRMQHVGDAAAVLAQRPKFYSHKTGKPFVGAEGQEIIPFTLNRQIAADNNRMCSCPLRVMILVDDTPRASDNAVASDSALDLANPVTGEIAALPDVSATAEALRDTAGNPIAVHPEAQ